MSERTVKLVIEHPTEYPFLEDVKGRPGDFVNDFVRNVEMKNFYYRMGSYPRKSYLLYGPPGTGKTFSVKAIHNELNKNVPEENKMNSGDLNFITIKYSVGRYGTSFINEGSKIIQGVFDTASGLARLGKNILIVFDEADALFQSRQGMRQMHSEDTKNLETIMTNMQEVHDSEGIYVVLMTNLEEVLDRAAIRSGRIDLKIPFYLPNPEERYIAFYNEINKVNSKADYNTIRKYDVEELVKLSEGMNYGDIENIVENVIDLRIKEMMGSSKKVTTPYATQRHLLKSLEKIGASKENKKPGFVQSGR